MANKTIRINHVEAVENYLEDEGLVYIDLERNAELVKGVNRLIDMLPKSFEPKDIKKFYKRTGLKVQVHVMKDCDLTIYDRKGKYPRDDAYIWNENFTENVSKHPEYKLQDKNTQFLSNNNAQFLSSDCLVFSI